MRKGGLLCISILLLSVASAALVGLVESRPAGTRVYIEIPEGQPTERPITITKSVDESFSINVRIEEVRNLYLWSFYLRWDPQVLEATDIVEGAFLKTGGATFFTGKIYNDEPGPDGFNGMIFSSSTLITGLPIGADGSGILAEVKFKVIGAGASILDIYKTVLINSFGGHMEYISGREDGYVNVETPPMFHVVPPSLSDPTLIAGAVFNVGINLSNVVELRDFKFKLGYDSAILNATDVTVIPFLNEPVSIDKGINRTGSFVWVNVISTAAAAVSGSGRLANITFQVKSLGESILDLYGTWLVDSLAGQVSEHSPPAEDGYFSNVPLGHDIAATKILAYPIKVKPGESISVNVTVTNAGEYSETFSVGIYYDSVLIASQDVTLGNGTKTTLEFIWDTADMSPGSYTLSTRASVVSGETRTDDNTRIYGAITIEATSSGPDVFLYAVAGIVGVIAVGMLIYFLKVRKPRVT